MSLTCFRVILRCIVAWMSNRCDIWNLKDSNEIWIHNYLVRKRTLNYLATLSVRLRTKWLRVRIPLLSLLILCLYFVTALFVIFCFSAPLFPRRTRLLDLKQFSNQTQRQWVFLEECFYRIHRVKKAKRQELPRNDAKDHLQVDLIIPPTKSFFIPSGTIFFAPSFKYHVVFQDQSRIT